MKKRNVVCLLVIGGFSLSVFAGLSHVNNTPVQADALSTMSIDTTDQTDSEVNAYYAGVGGLSGDALQSALHSIIDNHTSYSYTDDVDIMKITDRDWSLSPMTSSELASWTPSDDTGSGDPYLHLLYGSNYNGTANAVKWSEDHSTVWNKEHIWAKSHGGFETSAPAGTDLHHLVAADQGINNFHSNYDYGIPTNDVTTITDERGNATTSYRGTNADSPTYVVFEPPVDDRGDVARAIFYMATRYYTWNSVTDPKLVILDEPTYSPSTVTSTSTDPGKMAFLKTLLEWNEEDPVSDYEIHRNNLIDNNFQHNRNPYIDHPEWVDMVFDSTYSGSGASVSSGSACTIGSCTDGSGESTTTTLSSITLNTSAVQTAFNTGDSFNSDGLLVTATMSDGSSKTVSGFTTNPTTGTTLSSSGQVTVTVNYSENGVSASATYTINVGTSSSATYDNLFFSEYVEGSSYNKALEIYNGTGSSVDLSNYNIKLYTNGSSSASSTLTLSGSLAQGAAYVIYNSQASSSLIPTSNAVSSGVCNFNGDDAIGLYSGSSLIDVIGTIGTDPGTEWSGTDADGNATSTLDHTLRRVNIGSTVSFNFSDWESFACDSFADLGSYSAATSSTPVATLASLSLTSAPTTSVYTVGEAFSTDGLAFTATMSDNSSQSITSGYSLMVNGNNLANGDILSTTGTLIITATYTVNGVSATTTFSITVNAATTYSNLFFSEYIEGSSNNKALEIYNGTGATVDLSNYSVKLYVNGKTKASSTATLSGTLTNGSVYVLYNSQATSAFQPSINASSSGVCNFNGDDAIGLYYGSTLIDLIGVIGTDPGTSWSGTDSTGATVQTADQTLVRINTISGPNTTFTFSEWTGYACDTSSYLGSF